MPAFLHEVLQQLNWSDGMYIPIANEENKQLENLLNSRNKELQKLREENKLQEIKQNELIFHKKSIQYEHQENMQLLSVHKEHLEKEENMNKLFLSELSQIAKDKIAIEKKYKEIEERVERVHDEIAVVLRRIEHFRSTVGEEKESLEEWCEALKHSEADISVLNNFNKEDTVYTKGLEVKRQQLKIEYDEKHKKLIQICGNLMAEEKSAERTSDLIIESLEKRQKITFMWAGAVENLRQRDKEIHRFKKELLIMNEYLLVKRENNDEKEDFLNIQIRNNAEIERELVNCKNNLSIKQTQIKNMEDNRKLLENAVILSKKELTNLSKEINNVVFENKYLNVKILAKQDAIGSVHQQIKQYKEKLFEIMDSSKITTQHVKQLEDMINNEEKYLKQIIQETEKNQQQLFNSEHQLLSLCGYEHTLHSESKGYKTATIQYNAMLNKMEKELIIHRENLYNATYQLDEIQSKLIKLEGTKEIENQEVYEDKLEQLETISKEKINTLKLYSGQITNLEIEINSLIKSIENQQHIKKKMEEQYNKIIAEVEGAEREECVAYKNARNFRTDESILQLKLEHALRNKKNISHSGDSILRAHIDLHAAMKVREAEANKKQALLVSQRSILQKEKSSLIMQIKTEKNKIEQLKARYDIYLSSLGKDETGEPYSIAYFKIKNAQEKSELQEEGDKLDAQIRKGEKEIAALEATLQVVDAVNKRFVHNLIAIKEDDPEMLEYNNLCEIYKKNRFTRSEIILQLKHLSKNNNYLLDEINTTKLQIKDSQVRRDNLIDESLLLKKDIKEQQEKLSRANDLRKKSGANTKRKINSKEIWKIHEKQFHTKIIQEANRSASAQLRALSLPAIDKMALEEGISLPETNSAPLISKDKVSISSKSSYASSQESWIRHTSFESLSEQSTTNEERYSFTTKKYSDNVLHKFKKERKPTNQDSKESTSTSNTLPINVIVLGIDSIKKEKSRSPK